MVVLWFVDPIDSMVCLSVCLSVGICSGRGVLNELGVAIIAGNKSCSLSAIEVYACWSLTAHLVLEVCCSYSDTLDVIRDLSSLVVLRFGDDCRTVLIVVLPSACG